MAAAGQEWKTTSLLVRRGLHAGLHEQSRLADLRKVYRPRATPNSVATASFSITRLFIRRAAIVRIAWKYSRRCSWRNEYCREKISKPRPTTWITYGSLPAHTQTNSAAFVVRSPPTFSRDPQYARRIKPGALITANNSLNSSEVLYAQCRNYAYNIYEMSKTEDFVVVEDEGGMPRSLPNGQTHEYAPTYKQLLAVSHGKPVIAVTLAESDYHTPPHLVRLGMAEATANGAGYLGWPTWPENQRQRMIDLVRPQADFFRTNATKK